MTDRVAESVTVSEMPRKSKIQGDPPNRIHEVRAKKGMTLQQVADLAKTYRQTVSRLEKGEMELTVAWLEKIASALDVAPAQLLPGRPPGCASAPVVGFIGAGQEWHQEDDLGHAVDEVDVHPGMDGAVAVVVRGSSMRPVYRDGDMLFFDHDNPQDPEGLIGEECVVQVVDGSAFVKEIQRGSRPRLFTLVSHADDPIEDVRLEWAAPILWVKRSRRH